MLKHLSKQVTESQLVWEIILVDNNSDDGTVDFASEVWTQLGHPTKLRVVYEPIPGLSNARMKGVKEARGKILIFCDDDNWLESNYISNVHSIMSQNLKIGALGGKSIAKVDSIDLPDWFNDNYYKERYAIGEQNAETGYLPNSKLLFGAGLAIRKNLMQVAYENFPPLLIDRKGNELTSGGDTEICLRIRLMNYKLYYDNKLSFYHYLPNNRLTEEYRDNLCKSIQLCDPVIINYYYVTSLVNGIKGNRIKSLLNTIVKLSLCLIIPRLKWNKNEQIYKIIYFTGFNIIGVNNEIYKILKMAKKLEKYAL